MVVSKLVPAGATAIPTALPGPPEGREERVNGATNPYPYSTTKDSAKETMGREIVSPGFDDISTPPDDFEPEMGDLVKNRFKHEGPPGETDNEEIFEKQLA